MDRPTHSEPGWMDSLELDAGAHPHTPGQIETSVIGDRWDICAEGGGDKIADLGFTLNGEADAKRMCRAIAVCYELIYGGIHERGSPLGVQWCIDQARKVVMP